MNNTIIKDGIQVNSGEKKKWQIALRRYVIEKQFVVGYAPYFGLGIPAFRNWVEIQFDREMGWDNFGRVWQLEHVLPLTYFDFKNEHDLKLCWNFLNIRVEKPLSQGFRNLGPDTLSAKAYFKSLHHSTGYFLCNEMVKKIEEIESAQIQRVSRNETFINDNLGYLVSLENFTAYEFMQLNTGVTIPQILEERRILNKFK